MSNQFIAKTKKLKTNWNVVYSRYPIFIVRICGTCQRKTIFFTDFVNALVVSKQFEFTSNKNAKRNDFNIMHGYTCEKCE